MKSFIAQRFIFQTLPQGGQQPEQQVQPPVETGKEGMMSSPEAQKEGLPPSAEAVSSEYKEKAKQKISSESAKLDVFQNLKLG